MTEWPADRLLAHAAVANSGTIRRGVKGVADCATLAAAGQHRLALFTHRDLWQSLCKMVSTRRDLPSSAACAGHGHRKRSRVDLKVCNPDYEEGGSMCAQSGTTDRGLLAKCWSPANFRHRSRGTTRSGCALKRRASIRPIPIAAADLRRRWSILASLRAAMVPASWTGSDPMVPESWVGKRVWLYNGQRNGRWMGTAAEYIALNVDLVTAAARRRVVCGGCDTRHSRA